jgi:hypothetical protein
MRTRKIKPAIHFQSGGNKNVINTLEDVIKTVVDFDEENIASNELLDEVDTILQSPFEAPIKAIVVSLLSKLAYPEWDTRKHQVQLGGLYSLRSIDTTIVSKRLYEIGWYKTNTPFALTRSFELKEPYTMEYSGSIKPVKTKIAFLTIVNKINEDFNRKLCIDIIKYILNYLRKRHEATIVLRNSSIVIKNNVTLKTIKSILSDIFKVGIGMSVTPSIVTYTVCNVIKNHLWKDIDLRPLKEHTANDKHSIGDIEAYTLDNIPFMAIEIKHNLDITESIVSTFERKTTNVKLKYILTTKGISSKFTDTNIYIGNVVEWAVFYLHSCIIHNPDIASEFVILLRKTLLEYRNLGDDNKIKIDNIFTTHLV